MMSWVVDMEKKLEDVEPPAKVEKWPKHCIFRVPLRFKIKMVDGRANSLYKPQTVSLGPFHHDDEELKPMEEHKLRAVRHLLHRYSCKTTLAELVAAMEKVADELENAYMDLGDEWRGKENRGKFLEMMITDGCFLLEVIRKAIGERESIPKDYEHGDPVFSWHGIQHIRPFVQRDMLLVENQLPLRLLEKIVAAESGTSPSAASINSMVLEFLERKVDPDGTDKLGLHPLDIYRTSLLKKTAIRKHRGMEMDYAVARPQRVVRLVPRSAGRLSKVGIRFLPSKTGSLDDIALDNGRLYMPRVRLDDSTANRLHNLMAFEAMHAGTGNDVTEYVLFVKDLIDSADDVRLLVSKEILEHDLAHDAAVVSLFNDLTRGVSKNVSKNWESQLCRVREAVEHHYRSHPVREAVNPVLHEWWENLKSKYFRNPWTVLALLSGSLLVVGDIVQAVYAVKSYNPDKS